MQGLELFGSSSEHVSLAPGHVLLQRGVRSSHIYHLDEGRVSIGLLAADSLQHRVGTLQGPCWLNPSCALLDSLPIVDVVAETRVQLRRTPLDRFSAQIQALPEPVRALLIDVATAHRQQTEMAVSRLAKDAEARCAEWLLRHAQPARGAPEQMAVMLQQRKRLIAEQLGIAPETLSRVLRHLRERSLISGSGRVLNVLDPNGLRALAGV